MRWNDYVTPREQQTGIERNQTGQSQIALKHEATMSGEGLDD